MLAMKTIKTTICLLVLAFSFFGTERGNASQGVKLQEGSRQRARELWEQAIAAKGGRERLYSVRNLLCSTRDRKYSDVGLYVFPDKMWTYIAAPEPFGRSADMYNLERGIAYQASDSNPYSATELHKDSVGGGDVLITNAQIFSLLETRWLQPTPVGVSNGKVGRRETDVVRTVINDELVDFYLDRETHLPLKIAFLQNDGRAYYYATLSDYRLVDGIQIPHKMNYKDTGNVSENCRFNVEYDKSLFERPPTVAAGPDAWKPK